MPDTDLQPTTASKAARTRQRILVAAAELFSKRGYSNTRLTDIAEHAGVQTGSLYYHFPSREALVSEILHVGMDTAWQHVHNAVEAMPIDARPIERVTEAIRTHVLVVLEISTFASAQSRVVNEVPDDVRVAHLQEQRAYGEYWRGLLEDAQRAGEIDPALDLYMVRVALFATMNATTSVRLDRGSTAGDIAATIVRLVLHGAATDPAPQGPPDDHA